jgi:hypothetical protein
MDVGGEIRLGSALFTMVEPHRGYEVAYNRWYETDHFYAGCMVGPWLFAGRRWVSTRDLKDLRFGSQPGLFGDVRRGSYLALYWVLEGKHTEHFDWGLQQVKWLHENGRMFEHRDHVHTLLYELDWVVNGDPNAVTPELALDHPYGGLIATLVERAEGAGSEVVRSWLADDIQPPTLEIAFSPIPLEPDAPVSQPGLEHLERRTMLLGFLRDNPATIWDQHRAACDRLDVGGEATVLWSSGFVPTIPGTDTYTDQLW